MRAKDKYIYLLCAGPVITYVTAGMLLSPCLGCNFAQARTKSGVRRATKPPPAYKRLAAAGGAKGRGALLRRRHLRPGLAVVRHLPAVLEDAVVRQIEGTVQLLLHGALPRVGLAAIIGRLPQSALPSAVVLHQHHTRFLEPEGGAARGGRHLLSDRLGDRLAVGRCDFVFDGFHPSLLSVPTAAGLRCGV